MRFPASLLALAFLGTLTGAARLGAQPQHVAPTDPMTPADERKALKVPPGFEVQLVASEPDIQKPMQMAFDAKGRLWVTTSRHYPFAADAKATDKLFVLSDFGPDGKAKTVTVFAEDLNIPIGVLPLPDCNSCLVSSVGRIRKLTDTDGDGKADKGEDLFTGFGGRDTHGMVNSFTHLPDGWVYACHGFANESRVKGKDGHEVVMQSGHTFRFRPDGSRIEVYTRGQVNPFGMTVDPWFNLYTADCHSKPITQLIRGAYYDSFGKPHDGLGYAPHVTRHDHGSTALCGLAWYDADHYPAAYKGTMFLGNVVTNRVNFDRIEWKGSTPVAVEGPDFVTSSDPWFRPVDIKLGPDGALYVADFYNRIIGHYEVDLKHPGRDKDRGRIWRVVYKGEASGGRQPAVEPAEGLSAIQRMRELTMRWVLPPGERAEAHAALTKGPRVARAAVDVLAVHTHPSDVAPLVDLLLWAPAEDTHLRHAARIALRDHLWHGEAWCEAWRCSGDRERQQVLDDVALGAANQYAAGWLARRLKAAAVAPALAERAFEHVGRYGCDVHRDTAAESARADKDPKRMLARLAALDRGVKTAGATYALGSVSQVSVREWLQSDDHELVRRSIEVADLSRPLTVELLASLTTTADRPEAIRAAALDGVTKANRDLSVRVCGVLVRDPATPAGLREKAFAVFATSGKLLDLIALKDMLRDAPYRQAVVIATGLAGKPEGADLLFAAVKTGQASPRLLQEKVVLERLRATRVRNLDARVKELTAGLPSAEQRLQQLINVRGVGYKKVKPDAGAGKKAYAANCAACHQIAGQGGKVGPNLDGIGNRGLDRLLEDVLDPNRNVDVAFRATTLSLIDGRTLTGLLVREEGAVYVLADAEGKEQRIPKADVEKKAVTGMSPMPANVSEKVKEDEFYHLIAYLLELRAK